MIVVVSITFCSSSGLRSSYAVKNNNNLSANMEHFYNSNYDNANQKTVTALRSVTYNYNKTPVIRAKEEIKMRSPTYIQPTLTQPRFKEQDKMKQVYETNTKTMETPYIKKSNSVPQSNNYDNGHQMRVNSGDANSKFDNEMVIRKDIQYEKPTLPSPSIKQIKEEMLYDQNIPSHHEYKDDSEFFEFDDEFSKNEDKIVNNLVDTLIENIDLSLGIKDEINPDESEESKIDQPRKEERFSDEFDKKIRQNKSFEPGFLQAKENIKTASPVENSKPAVQAKNQSQGGYVPKYTLI